MAQQNDVPSSTYTVASVSWKGHVKLLKLAWLGEAARSAEEWSEKDQLVLRVPLSACVSTGDRVRVDGASAWVQCRNGEAQILQPYAAVDRIKVGGVDAGIIIKEITEPEEMEGYRSLTEFHYRGHVMHGRTARLIVRTVPPLYPAVIGYIELATPLYMNKARAHVMDGSFVLDGISWNRFSQQTLRQYIHLFVRIARVVVYPEFRGLGVAQILLRHAIAFTRTRWQVSSYMPYFIEISADMLKYVPFVKKAGMVYVGETEGNLGRVRKDMAYLTGNLARVEKGEVAKEDSFGIVDTQVSRLAKAKELMRKEGMDREELLKRLQGLTDEEALEDFALLQGIITLPKPTYMMGLRKEAHRFLLNRVEAIKPTPAVSPSGKERLEIINGDISVHKLTLSYTSTVPRNAHTNSIDQAFGISPDAIQTTALRDLSFSIRPGEVLLVVGPSGSGKTTLLNFLAQPKLHHEGMTSSGGLILPGNYRPGMCEEPKGSDPLIQLFDRSMSVGTALDLMGLVGLSDAFLYLRRYPELSKGQQYRVQLAQLIASNSNVWVADEFCTNLDVITANVVADRMQKAARSLGATVIVGAAHYHMILQALKPDWVLELSSIWDSRLVRGEEYQLTATTLGVRSEPTVLRVHLDVLDDVLQRRLGVVVLRGARSLTGLPILLTDGKREVLAHVGSACHGTIDELVQSRAKLLGFTYPLDFRKEIERQQPKVKGSNVITVAGIELL